MQDGLPDSCCVAEDISPNMGIWNTGGFKLHQIADIMVDCRHMEESHRRFQKKWILFILLDNKIDRQAYYDDRMDLYWGVYEKFDMYPKSEQDRLRFVIQLEWKPYEPIKLDLTRDDDIDLFEV